MKTLYPNPHHLFVESPTKTKQKQHVSSSANKSHPFISLIEICRSQQSELIQLHSLLIKTNLIRQTYAFGRLLSSFASLSDPIGLDYAQKLFDSVDCPKTTFIYNTLIRAYSNSSDPTKALFLFSKMICEDSYSPDSFTFTFVFSACSKLSAVSVGKQAHAQMVKNPFRIGTHSQNALMGFYMKTGEMGFVLERVFDEILEPDVVSWNCLLDGFVKSGDLESARNAFDKMPARDIVSWTTMLTGYANDGLLKEARCLFDKMPEKNVVSWSAMINGYVRLGQYKVALSLFEEMLAMEVKPDKIMMTTMLSACANLGALDQGHWIHAYIDKSGIEVDAHLATALIDMYAKCGRIDDAFRVFQEAKDKRVFLWNAMLGGLAMHSFGKEAIQLFWEMLESGTRPNEITFICILSACSHSGLVNDGLQIFNSMVKDHNVVPTLEHYGCVVDLLGRAGLLDDAKWVIESMPVEADGSIWRALLGACRQHGDIKLGEHVGSILIDLEPLNDANYVLLSNVYAVNNRWQDVAKLRRIMKVRGVRKTPGCSSIELNGVVHEFVAGAQSHPQSREIYTILDEITCQVSAAEHEP